MAELGSVFPLEFHLHQSVEITKGVTCVTKWQLLLPLLKGVRLLDR